MLNSLGIIVLTPIGYWLRNKFSRKQEYKIKQKQKFGDNSLGIQAKKFTINQRGITFTEARQIAQDVFDLNTLKLINQAKECAEQRAIEISDSYIQKLLETNDRYLSNFVDPDLQYAIFSVQQAYARNGDKENGELLLNILINRTKERDRNLKQIVLNEALQVAPKLVKPQLNALALIFLLKYLKYNDVSLATLKPFLIRDLVPLSLNLEKKSSYYQHLDFTGCTNTNLLTIANIPNCFLQNYPHIFCKDFNLESESKIENWLKENIPNMEKILSVWSETSLKSMNLNSVGIAIAHAYIQQYTGNSFELSLWI